MSCAGYWQPGGKWSAEDNESQSVKYSPKRKHGKPVGRRQVVEKYLALGIDDLERAFNGGDKCPEHAQMSADGRTSINDKHAAIHARVVGYAHNKHCGCTLSIHKSTRRRRAAKKAAQDELLDYEDCE